MVDIVEEHLVPAVASSQDESHDPVDYGPLTVRVAGQESIPRKRVGEVRNEHPSRRESATSEERHGEHEPPTLTEGPSERPSPEKPDARPETGHKSRVLAAAREPLAPELLVALAACARIREAEVPLHGEERSSVVEAEEVDNGDKGHREDQAVPLVAPLLERVLEFLGVPSELALDQQIHCARMVAIVLKHELLPWQREEIAEGVGDKPLPLIRRESGSVHHIVINVDVLDSDVGKRDTKKQRARPPVVGEASQRCGICNHREALTDENESKDVPHVHHLFRRDLCEEEG
mmetsp:Transcript_44233/g.96219  ORF Transcript_44233/g.96219 Transcript_44233/m.96219 type:complete len:291 (-) Transcript_44233:400-1272(-)